ncbi:MAG TPA: hypothetical protein ENJ09_14800 [Planctomycetes bacterium]|nr:hypothetical protein [Planctomycetota bacterium]
MLPLLGNASRRAESVSDELYASWREAEPSWFAGEASPLPTAPTCPHLRLVQSPLGPVVAKRAHRRARAVRAFDLARSLLARGLATPEPLAAWPSPHDGASILLTRLAPGHSPWNALREKGGAATRTARAFAETAGHTIARLHAAGFRHRDLKEPNLLLTGDPDRGFSLTFLDLDGLFERGDLSRRSRVRDLARLRVSFSSRAALEAGIRPHHFRRVLHSYLEETPAEFDRYLAATARWANRHTAHILARGDEVT